MKNDLTQARLRELLDYDSESGVFVWKVKRGGWRDTVGKVAGHFCTSDGYVRIWIDGQIYMSHRLAWLWSTGAFPADQIDHINGVRNDNRWSNLREASVLEQRQNHKLNVNNTSGQRGVSWCAAQGKWRAVLGHKNESLNLGLYADFEDAKINYITAREYLYEFQPTPRDA